MKDRAVPLAGDMPDIGPDPVTSLSNRGYGILKASVDPVALDTIRKTTTVSPRTPAAAAAARMVGGGGGRGNRAAAAPAIKFPVHLESRAKLYIPKALGLSVYGEPTHDKTDEGAPLLCAFEGELRDTQRPPVAAFLAAARDPLRRGGIINMACAAGKTVMALHIVCALGRRAMVVVHKEFLMDQWAERIAQFVPAARVGRVQGTVFDVQDRDIVLCMLQTLSGRTFDADAFDGFGTVVVDECHHTSAQVFSRGLHKINFRYSMGLSATVTRKDGLSHVFQWFLGPIVFRARRSRDNDVEVFRHVFRCNDSPYRDEVFCFGSRLNMARMVTNVVSCEPRARFVADLVLQTLRERPGSKVLVLSERRAHLMDLERRLRTQGTETAFYLGGMKQEALKHAETRSVIFGTFAMAAEGMDIPALDTLVLASPKSDVEQAVGRVLRVRAADRVRAPRVLDVVDDFSVFAAQGRRRHSFYRSSGFTISAT